MMLVMPTATAIPRKFNADAGSEGTRLGVGNYEDFRADLLDAYNIEVAMLNPASSHTGHPNAEFAHAICQAVNEWTLEAWLENTGDTRLRASVQVPMHIPELAAAEIRRAGQDDRFVSVYLAHNSLGKPIGHPIYHPIYAAAAEMDMPIYTHLNGGEYMGSAANYMGGGDSHQYQLDVMMASSQSTATHLTSLITHGVFEKYPNLRYMMAEPGVSWLVWLVARLESNYELLRTESSWVKRRPLEYIHDRCAVSTQPIEATPQTRRNFVANLELIDGIEDILCFSSDYPHDDGDWPPYVGSHLAQGMAPQGLPRQRPADVEAVRCASCGAPVAGRHRILNRSRRDSARDGHLHPSPMDAGD